ncbi:molybdopterin molybdotransferase MoeA [Novosphingobium terrae]|uniref:molybdopterin molybdotransferase MoeA n=1 Tax=Novosphingobium terrae TaxID=2726189 RepID=UPI001981993C|nr:gephyrin-like molybdotransferase Glp [Novosphingobium terrae]
MPPLPLAEAQQRLLSTITPLPVETLPIEQAARRWLAEPLAARRTQPAADLSAMDGYAMRAQDLPGPWRVVGESAAGHPWPHPVQPGEAIRIATGALMPAGADAMVLQEDVTRDGDHLTLTGDTPNPPGRHIRRTGLDFTQGTPLLPAGTRLGPAQIALAISGGHGSVSVRRLPRVTIIDSGDELVSPGTDPLPHQIPASNGAMLAAMVGAVGAEVTRIGPVLDDLSALVAALQAAGEADLIVTSGGASVGDHDLIRPALEAWGAQLAFWRVAMRPGKPLMHARRGACHILGLPGNPVSGLVCGQFFLLPMLRAMMGASTVLPRRVSARLTAPVPAGGKRQEFLRGLWDGETVTPNPMRDSSALAAMAASNCLIDRPIDADAAEMGATVGIYLLDTHSLA